MSDIRIIDPVTKEVLFDSDKVTPEMQDPDRGYMAGRQDSEGRGWSICTREQLARQVDAQRPSIQDCVTCEGSGVIYDRVDKRTIICPTCQGVVRS